MPRYRIKCHYQSSLPEPVAFNRRDRLVLREVAGEKLEEEDIGLSWFAQDWTVIPEKGSIK